MTAKKTARKKTPAKKTARKKRQTTKKKPAAGTPASTAPRRGPGGSEGKYKPEYAEQAAKLCALGATDQEVAGFFGVHRATLYRWRVQHPELVEAMAVGKEAADQRVEQSLYHKSVGYTFDAEKIVVDSRSGKVTRVKYVEHVPPDTTACIFWLKNRKPDEWRDRYEHTGAGGGPMEHRHGLTDEQLETIAAKALKKSAKKKS